MMQKELTFKGTSPYTIECVLHLHGFNELNVNWVLKTLLMKSSADKNNVYFQKRKLLIKLHNL